MKKEAFSAFEAIMNRIEQAYKFHDPRNDFDFDEVPLVEGGEGRDGDDLRESSGLWTMVFLGCIGFLLVFGAFAGFVGGAAHAFFSKY